MHVPYPYLRKAKKILRKCKDLTKNVILFACLLTLPIPKGRGFLGAEDITIL
jgi:hypothetical protein